MIGAQHMMGSTNQGQAQGAHDPSRGLSKIGAVCKACAPSQSTPTQSHLRASEQYHAFAVVAMPTNPKQGLSREANPHRG